MKMKKTLILMAAAASVVLTGCTESDISSDTSLAKESAPSAIEFSAKTRNAGATRTVTDKDYEKGSIGNNSNTANGIKSLAQARFGVFSYLTKTDYNPASVDAAPSNIAPNFMYDQEIQYDDALSWIYSPVKYWPNGTDSQNAANAPSQTAEQDNTYAKQLSFFAYAPYKAMEDFSTVYAQATYGEKPAAIGSGATNDGKVKIASAVTNGIQAMTTNDWTGNVWLKYLMPNANETDAVDLLWGLRGSTNYGKAGSDTPDGATVGESYNLNLTKQTVDERVSFLFKHALAKVGGSSTTTKNLDEPSTECGFKVKLDVDGNSDDHQTDYFASGFDKTKTLVTIKNVKIMDGTTANSQTFSETSTDIFSSGWFNIETGTWDMTGATKTGTIDITVQNDKSQDDASNNKYTLNPKIRENSATPAVKNTTGVDWNPSAASSADGYTGGAEGVEVTAKPLFANEYVPALMFIPGNESQTIYVQVDYIVRTADANLADCYTEVEQVILNKVELPASVLKSNKIYNIIMHIGLTSVKFEAVVSDWQEKSDSSVDEEGKETGGSNENKASVWLPSNVVAKTQTASLGKDDTSYTFDGSGLGLGDFVSSTVADGTIVTEIAKNTSDSQDVEFTLSANSTGSERSAIVTLTYELGKVTLTLKQAGE